MLFSTFSHIQFFHIALNMVALYSMSDLISRILPLEQFFAYYLSSGVFASFASNMIKILRFSLGVSHTSFSLGAVSFRKSQKFIYLKILSQSGAVTSCFALASLIFPHSKFYIFPFPFEIEAQTVSQILKFLQKSFTYFLLVIKMFGFI